MNELILSVGTSAIISGLLAARIEIRRSILLRKSDRIS
jgi:hypothetical protein